MAGLHKTNCLLPEMAIADSEETSFRNCQCTEDMIQLKKRGASTKI